MTELSAKISCSIFCRKATSQMFNRALMTPLLISRVVLEMSGKIFENYQGDEPNKTFCSSSRTSKNTLLAMLIFAQTWCVKFKKLTKKKQQKTNKSVAFKKIPAKITFPQIYQDFKGLDRITSPSGFLMKIITKKSYPC